MKTVALLILLGLSACLWGAPPDGDQVYKSNCNRCHITIRTYPEKMTRSIVRHMRIKAGLTKPEADAVLAYLAENFDPAQKSKAKGARQ
jgi:mono/diheme cytochrome c family protein